MASMNGTFTIEFCAEDRARLDKLAEALMGLNVNVETTVEVEAPITEPAPVAEEPEPPKYTAAEIQLKVQKLAAPASGKRDAVRQIVKEYADRVSEIPEDKFAEVMERLTALEEGKA